MKALPGSCPEVPVVVFQKRRQLVADETGLGGRSLDGVSVTYQAAPATATPTPTPTPTALKEAEPNDSVATAQVISVSSAAISGSISSNADNDYYRYSIPAGKTLKVTLSAGSASVRRPGCPMGYSVSTRGVHEPSVKRISIEFEFERLAGSRRSRV